VTLIGGVSITINAKAPKVIETNNAVRVLTVLDPLIPDLPVWYCSVSRKRHG
jgi:type III secretory pathway component EscV